MPIELPTDAIKRCIRDFGTFPTPPSTGVLSLAKDQLQALQDAVEGLSTTNLLLASYCAKADTRIAELKTIKRILTKRLIAVSPTKPSILREGKAK